MKEKLRNLQNQENLPELLTLQQQRIELNLSQIELNQEKEINRLAMPFEGELQLNFEYYEDQSHHDVKTGDLLAIARDTTKLYTDVSLKLSNQLFYSNEQLVLKIQFGYANSIYANYSSTYIKSTFNTENKIYRFAIDPKQIDLVKPMLDERLQAKVIMQFEEPAIIIPKMNALLAKPEAFKTNSWQEGVAKAFEGWTLLAVGESQLALQKVE